MAIGDQPVAIARLDQLPEQLQIAAEAEHAGRAAAQHQEFERHLVGAESLLDQPLPIDEIGQHRRGEAGAALRAHIGPQRLAVGIVGDIEFGEAKQLFGDGALAIALDIEFGFVGELDIGILGFFVVQGTTRFADQSLHLLPPGKDSEHQHSVKTGG